MNTTDKQILWAIYYASLVSMERHPGKHKDGQQPLSLQQLAHLADAMMLEHNDRWDN